MGRVLLDGWIWVLVTYMSFVDGQLCTTSNGLSGECKSIFDCDDFLTLGSSLNPQKPKTLQYTFCELDETTQNVQVCCPPKTCKTPSGDHGTCVELYACTHFMKLLKKSVTLQLLINISSHVCDGAGRDKVCCPSEEPIHRPPRLPPPVIENDGECKPSYYPPDPRSKCCGFHSGEEQRIVGGQALSIDEFPWLVLLEYQKDNETITDCGGTLISGIYVLTAAHCVKNRALVNVILGEHNTSNPGQDCETVSGEGNYCNDGTLIVPVETVRIHPEFNRFSKEHDIALIKLKNAVKYTAFVRPICLPRCDFSNLKIDWKSARLNLYVAGWGYMENKKPSDIKRAVDVVYVPLKRCKHVWKYAHNDVPLVHETKLCAGGENGKDSCKGDSGGPLMREIDNQYELVGVVSHGPDNCGTSQVPSLYTKVYNYLDWIESQIAELSANDPYIFFE